MRPFATLPSRHVSVAFSAQPFGSELLNATRHRDAYALCLVRSDDYVTGVVLGSASMADRDEETTWNKLRSLQGHYAKLRRNHLSQKCRKAAQDLCEAVALSAKVRCDLRGLRCKKYARGKHARS